VWVGGQSTSRNNVVFKLFGVVSSMELQLEDQLPGFV
jgi:hypothetical protein